MRRVEVKKIMKKNQVIITSLAILIAVAGYLNFADVDLGFKDKETSTDSSSILEDVDYDLTDETALLDENGADGTTQSEVMDTASPGEAVLTGASDFAAQAKVSREQVRSQNKAVRTNPRHKAKVYQSGYWNRVSTTCITAILRHTAVIQCLINAIVIAF